MIATEQRAANQAAECQFHYGKDFSKVESAVPTLFSGTLGVPVSIWYDVAS